MSPKLNYVFKFAMAGDPAVGKTSLVRRYSTNTFRENYLTTIGVQVSSKEVSFSDIINVKIIIWDVAGQEAFNAMKPLYFKESDAVILVFSVTDRTTFDNIDNWDLRVKENAPNAVRILVGNKIDLVEFRKVSYEEGRKKAAELGIPVYLETSAKNNSGVTEIFVTAIKMCMKKRLQKLKQAT